MDSFAARAPLDHDTAPARASGKPSRASSKQGAVFLHVEKCAGTSVIQHLHAVTGADHVYDVNFSRYMGAPLERLLSLYPVVTGHLTFEALSDEVLARAFAFTFLRDPVDRILSLYHFWRQVEHHENHATALAKSLDLEAVLETAATGRPSPWSNWQTFVFSGASDCEASAPDLLAAAKRNLESLDFVGISEELNAGMAHLCDMRGWPHPDALAARLNVTPNRPARAETPTPVLDKIRRLNACDLELYAHARALWEGRVPARPPAAIAATPATPRPRRAEHGSQEITVTAVQVVDHGFADAPAHVVAQNGRTTISILGRSTIDADDITVGIRITDTFGAAVYGTNTHLLARKVAVAAGADFRVDFNVEMILAPGVYWVTAALHEADSHHHKCYHWIDNAEMFECRSQAPMTFSGLADLKASVEIASDQRRP